MLALFVVASRPFSTALLLTLFVAALLLADSPPVIRDVIRLVALFPMMRLLPGMIPQKYRTSFYVFLGLLLSQYSHVLFRIGSGAERSALLVASVGVSVILGRLIFDNAERTGRRKTVLIRGSVLLMFGAFLLLIAASLANIVGYGVMAKVLGDGGLASIYSALAIYAVVRILEGLWSLFISSGTAHGLRAVHDHSAVILNRGRFVIRASLFVWWLSNTPSRFGLEYLSTSWTMALLQQSFKVGALSINVSNILAFVLTLWGAILISRFVRFILETDVFPRSGTPQGMRSATSTLTNYVLLSIGLLAALSAAGVNYESVALLAGAFGIGIGFGLQTIVNNFVSGLILIFERPIQVGDVIEFTGPGGNQMAQVSRIGIRSSVVRKFDGAEVILPNSTLVSNAVTNWTKTDKRRRIELLIHVALDTSPKEVLDILHKVAAANPGILKDPAPLALFREFGTHSLDFSLWAWTADFDIGLSLKSEMAVVLHESLKEAGIEIAIPARKISFESGADQASISMIVPETGSEETPEIQ